MHFNLSARRGTRTRLRGVPSRVNRIRICSNECRQKWHGNAKATGGITLESRFGQNLLPNECRTPKLLGVPRDQGINRSEPGCEPVQAEWRRVSYVWFRLGIRSIQSLRAEELT